MKVKVYQDDWNDVYGFSEDVGSDTGIELEVNPRVKERWKLVFAVFADTQREIEEAVANRGRRRTEEEAAV